MRCYNLATARQNRSRVTVLMLDRQGLAQIPPEVWEMPGLETLDLRGNAIHALPDNFHELTSLKVLLLGDNQLKNLPQQMPDLVQIDLSNNRFSELQVAPGQLKHLQKLNIGSNRLKNLPDLPFPVLKELILEGNLLTRFYLTQAHYPKIEKLNLAKNRLSEFDIQGSFPHLHTLDLSRNKLKRLSDHFADIPFLRALHLSNNQISTLPHSLAQCVWLKELNLAKNGCSELPPYFATLERLEEINLEHNAFAQWPHLPAKLRKFKVARNHLTTVPESFFFQNKTLRSLDLSNNPLERLPGLSACAGLENLTLPKVCPPEIVAEVLKLPRPAILHGMTGSPLWKKLLPFAKACARKKIPESERLLLWEALEEKTNLSSLALPLLLKGIGLGIPALQQDLRQHLLKRRSPDFAIKNISTGSALALIGRMAQSRQDLKYRLEQKGFNLCSAAQALFWVLVNPPFPNKLPENSGITWLDETELEQLLGPEVPVFDAQEQKNLQQLLLHADPINVRLAAQLLSHNGVPPDMLPHLYLAWRWAKEEKLRRELRALLSRYWPSAHRNLLRARVQLTRDTPWEEVEKQLAAILAPLKI
ncbi:leucine-rich repeat domain-containing protein [Haliscomenobacter hydrossis]|uniref:Leucine-rich repeat-containing protein n=1 Tax=Haliscomenobacter hydrossis (strain ATCC 27775 / DSM 1100 / LMG 10767 / O) TaxID=760192 RepID=F4L5H4_HALH1|nr:leucine-rich repeat domain-containing protein [Haliscomenobacter hydrossis]AEE50838.1 leucine-rich repeat-containing protein [Haliscomenobacter hydrossis DSM 1100]